LVIYLLAIIAISDPVSERSVEPVLGGGIPDQCASQSHACNKPGAMPFDAIANGRGSGDVVGCSVREA